MDDIASLREKYRTDLLNDTVPFWLNHALDREHGGYYTSVARDGTLTDSDKSVWFQGRFAWLLSTLSADVEANAAHRDQWTVAAKSGIEFLQRYGFAPDGQMYFTVTSDGKPLRLRRYVFSEMFAVMAMAAFARATSDVQLLATAFELREQTYALIEAGELPQKTNSTTRPLKGLALPMIGIVVGQELRRAIQSVTPNDNSRIDAVTSDIDAMIDEIERDFLNEEFQSVMETVGPNGEFIDHVDGRTINPGHAIEAAWFVLEESRLRRLGRSSGQSIDDAKCEHLVQLGLKILDWSWKWGWDSDHGGIIYFRDVRGLPVQEYWHDMKFWWPQNEAIIATLLAYECTGEPKYLQWHSMAHDWAHEHHADPKFGEWYGYLHRDGRISSTAKGTMWKGPFHLPRMQLVCWQTCDRLLSNA